MIKDSIVHAVRALSLASFLATVALAQEVPSEPASSLDSLSWRSVGPAVMSGRVVGLAVHPENPSTIYVASASGGVWKTTNRGTSWKPLFDDQTHLSIGDITLATSNPNVVWVGTGEANNQRSSYAGNGVYKSVDGGDKWSHMGLVGSHHIGRIVVHPSDPNVVFVAALGHLYSKNEERGLFRTRDGGKTWDQVLKVDQDTGVVDVLLDPENPELVLAASYERRRRAWNLSETGPGSGLWRSTDGGTTFRRVEGGFPSGSIGRIGLATSSGPDPVFYACVENQNPSGEADSPRTPPDAREPRDRASEPREVLEFSEEEIEEEAPTSGAAAPRPIGGEVYRSDDRGETWTRTNTRPVSGSPAYYYGQIRVDPNDAQKVWLLGVPLFRSEDGGKTWKSDGARGTHVDHHALWINPRDSDHMLLGNDGGLAMTYDRGKHWDVFNNLPLGQYYAVGVDESTPYRIYGGLQDNGSWGIPSVGSTRTGILESEVVRVNSGDGFYCAVDPEDSNIVYSESQFGRPSRLDLRTGQRQSIRPRRARGAAEDRWNWMTPIVISPHNPRQIYVASQHLYRSYDRGDTWEKISQDLTTNDAKKLLGNVPHCTITTLVESPKRAGVLWVGTDDGKVHLTQDGGRHWRDLTDLFPLEVQGLWVSRVEASPHDPAKAYVAFSGYRDDHFEPYLFVTDDYGGNWSSLSGRLPRSPVNVIREDARLKDLLFVGTEQGVLVSRDGGDTWDHLRRGLPSVPVHDLAIQQRDGELVAATHGRGLFVLDYAWLRELPKALEAPAHLFSVKVIPGQGVPFDRGYEGARTYRGDNPPAGANLVYHLAEKQDDEVALIIRDAQGSLIRRLTGPGSRGLHVVRWDLRGTARRRGGRAAAEGGTQLRPARGGGAFRAPPTSEGDYVVSLELKDQTLRALIRIPKTAVTPMLQEDAALLREESEEPDHSRNDL